MCVHIIRLPFQSGVHKAMEEDAAPAPLERTYWVGPGEFLAGAYPGDTVPEKAAEKLRAIIDAGIRCFVDLTSGLWESCRRIAHPNGPFGVTILARK